MVLLPDQSGVFRDTSDDYLYGDAGISEEVKDIATVMGDDLREQLLNNEIARTLKTQGYEAANDLIHELLVKIGDYVGKCRSPP